jgi:hypothetical protein
MTPFERMLESTLFVAADRAQREWRPIAVEHSPVAWTVRPASDMTPDGYERLVVVPPGNHTEEAIMGVAKRINLARAQGQPVAAAVLRFFDTAPAARPTPLLGDALPAAVNSNDVAKQFGEPQMTPYTEPSPIGDAVGYSSSNAVRDIQSLDCRLDTAAWMDQKAQANILAKKPAEDCTLCNGPSPPCVSLCEKAMRIPVEPPTIAPEPSAPQSGPYQPATPPASRRRSKNAPATGQGSLF